MILKLISLYHIRNFEKRQFKINPNLTAIFGDNARGKTNLLEGIYFILKGDNNPEQDPGRVRFKQIKRVLIGVIY